MTSNFRKLLGTAVISLGALAMAPSVSARPLADVYVQCGIGGLLFKETNWAAVTSNIIWDLGTTAILSDLSSAENCQGGKAKTAALIFQSYAQLEQDLARGEGQYLDALMATAGCSAAAQPQVKAGLRQDLAARVAAGDYTSASRLQQSQAMLESLGQQAQGGACTI
ncbi:MAG: hypothetical protein RL722_2271 [Pseudomonadota bacterium]|jgi:hypothetical protein